MAYTIDGDLYRTDRRPLSISVGTRHRRSSSPPAVR